MKTKGGDVANFVRKGVILRRGKDPVLLSPLRTATLYRALDLDILEPSA